MERAVNLAAELEVPAIGGPVGGLSVVQAAEPEQVDRRYDELICDLGNPTAYAKKAGLEERLIEPTPLVRDVPWNVADAQKLLKTLGVLSRCRYGTRSASDTRFTNPFTGRERGSSPGLPSLRI